MWECGPVADVCCAPSPAQEQRDSVHHGQEHGVLQALVRVPALPTLRLCGRTGNGMFLYLGFSTCKMNMIMYLICGAVGGED